MRHEAHHHHEHAQYSDNLPKTAVKATLHCLTGCALGETIGLTMGVYFLLGAWPTMIAGTVLAFLIGFSLAMPPVMRTQNLSFKQAFHALWLGESISIGIMEIVMNAVDYMVGGVQTNSLTNPIFYIGLALAIPAGFLAAWPVNYYLLKNEIKSACH